ncbi:30S ribosomal protein S14 [Streptomyces sp. NPDC051453]|uniref:30S ribosomal protein S14 n=1 Tax=Streptomyces sp. NPDC051453 TaxID=3154941 RepID=UPI003448B7C7
MARKSKTAKGEKRRRVVVRCAVRRAELNEIVRRLSSTAAERAAVQRKLARQPRGASATRVGNRDSTDGPPHGHRRALGLSRVSLREQARSGFLPGVRKSSW